MKKVLFGLLSMLIILNFTFIGVQAAEVGNSTNSEVQPMGTFSYEIAHTYTASGREVGVPTQYWTIGECVNHIINNGWKGYVEDTDNGWDIRVVLADYEIDHKNSNNWRNTSYPNYTEETYRIQRALADLHYLTRDDCDGQFGPITRAAVVAFQTHNNISVDGSVGPVTYFRLSYASS